jgi:hypothetical protein
VVSAALEVAASSAVIVTSSAAAVVAAAGSIQVCSKDSTSLPFATDDSIANGTL